MKRLCVEGWRFLPHSYAIVNQWQLLSLLKRDDLSLRVRDAPLFRPNWKQSRGMLSEEQENLLAAIPKAVPGEPADATYRIAYPYDFSLSAFGRTIVFATSELKTFWPMDFKSPPDFVRLAQMPNFAIVTPSHWSEETFLRAGLRNDQVHVVPHGVDTDIFRSDPAAREAARKRLGLSGFVFGNASAMSTNKGLDVLLRAFAAVAEKHADVDLLLKGVDALYPSEMGLRKTIATVLGTAKDDVVKRIHYIGGTVTAEAMADFYRAMDVYVSPYLAEGFNLPVLEAFACGTPVICTKGGSTDNFVAPTFARLIDSKKTTIREHGLEKTYLAPSLDHLIALMTETMENDGFRNEAAATGPQHATRYTWDAVTGRLLNVMFPSDARN